MISKTRRGYLRCEVCNKPFKLKPEDKKLVGKISGLSDIFSRREVYEAFDCPACGCQNVVCERIPEVSKVNHSQEPSKGDSSEI